MKPIICKPKISAYFSVGLVLLICYAWLIYLFTTTVQLEQAAWWRYVLMAVLAAFATVLSIRLFGNFKVITAKTKELAVRWPLLFKQQVFLLDSLEEVEMQQVKTPTGLYEQLLLHFPNKTIKIGNQEYEQYDKLKNYIKQAKSNTLHPKASKRKRLKK